MSQDSLRIEASAIKRFGDHLGEVATDIEFIRFSARLGETGKSLDLDFTIDGQHCTGTIEAGHVRAWFTESPDTPLETIHF